MRQLISLITTAAFLLHLGLGCGAHHAHAAGATACALPTLPADHGHCPGHDHSVPDSETPEHPGSHDDCHETHCTFLVAGKTTVVPDTLVTALPPVAFDTVLAQTASSSANWLRDTGDHLRLPVRLHLFHQVLLI